MFTKIYDLYFTALLDSFLYPFFLHFETCLFSSSLRFHLVMNCVVICYESRDVLSSRCPVSELCEVQEVYQEDDSPDLDCFLEYGREIYCQMLHVEIYDYFANIQPRLTSKLQIL